VLSHLSVGEGIFFAMRDSVIIYRSWYEAIKDLDAEVKVALYEAIIHYGLNQEEPKLHGIAQVVWQLIKPNLDANYRKWENGQKGAAHGGKGGRPKKPQANPTETPQGITEETPTKPQRNPKRTPNVNVNVNVNENVNENVDERVSEISWPLWAGPNVLKAWNEFKAYRWTTHKVKYKSSSTEQHAVNLLAKYYTKGEDCFDALNLAMAKGWKFPVDPKDLVKQSIPKPVEPTTQNKMQEQKRIRLEIEAKYGIEPGGAITKDMVPREQWAIMGMDKMI
jgi:hypothetical protein